MCSLRLLLLMCSPQVMIQYRHYLEAETHLKMEAQNRGVSAQRVLLVCSLRLLLLVCSLNVFS